MKKNKLEYYDIAEYNYNKIHTNIILTDKCNSNCYYYLEHFSNRK